MMKKGNRDESMRSFDNYRFARNSMTFDDGVQDRGTHISIEMTDSNGVVTQGAQDMFNMIMGSDDDDILDQEEHENVIVNSDVIESGERIVRREMAGLDAWDKVDWDNMSEWDRDEFVLDVTMSLWHSDSFNENIHDVDRNDLDKAIINVASYGGHLRKG